jgi:predicted MFS family arabinose efflux permease
VVAEAYPQRLRGRAAGVLQAGSPVAMAMAAAMGCFAGPVIGWQTCFLFSAIPALLVFFARRAMPGEDRAPGRNTGSLIDLFRGRLLRPSLAMLTLLCLHMTGFWCTYAWLPSHLMREVGVAPAFVGWFQIGVNIGHVVGDLLFGFHADRFGRKRMFTLYCVMAAAGLLAVALAFEFLAADLVLFGLVMAVTGIGFGTWSCFGVLFAANYDAEIRATAAAGFYNLSRGVQLFTLPMIGWLVASTGTSTVALHVGAGMALLSAVAIRWVPVVDR